MKIIPINKCSDCPKFENVDCDVWNEADYETCECLPDDGDCPPLEGCPLEDVPKKEYIKGLELFMSQVSIKLKCLPDFNFPSLLEGNQHIGKKIDELIIKTEE